MGIGRKPPADIQQLSEIHYATYRMGEPLPKSVVAFSPEILVHLSWSGIPDFSAETCVDNVATQAKFIGEAERISGLRRIVAAGSCIEYGGKKGLCRETDRPVPNSHLSWAKQSLCSYFQVACQQRNIELLWFRIFYVYGPGQRPAALIPSLLKAYRCGQSPEINSPDAANDFVFVDDVVDAFVLGVEQEQGAGIVNIGSGRLTTVGKVSRMVERSVNTITDQTSGLFDGRTNQETSLGMFADISRANAVLAWKPRTSLSEGIVRTAELMV